MKSILLLCAFVSVALAAEMRPTRRPGTLPPTTEPPILSRERSARQLSCQIRCLIPPTPPNVDYTCNTTCNNTANPVETNRNLTVETRADAGSRLRCDTRCLVTIRTGFACNRTCNANPPSRVPDQCSGDNRTIVGQVMCASGQVCNFNASTLRRQCIRRPMVGERCERESDNDGDDDDDEDERNEIRESSGFTGSSDRTRTMILRVSQDRESQECGDGLRCAMNNTCTRQTGACANASVSCDNEGNVSPLQCGRRIGGGRQCWCSHPNGTMIPGTRTSVMDEDDKPDCETRVFRPCGYSNDNRRNFRIPHGQEFVNRTNCTRCRCLNGQGRNCELDEDNNCGRLNPGPNARSCVKNGVTIQHGETGRMVGKGCNRCGCNNGQLRCTESEGCRDDDDEPDENEMRCRNCDGMPRNPVCGRDGQTYPTRCHAMQCSGKMRDEDIRNSSCADQQMQNIPCYAAPCRNSNETCSPHAGVACLRNEGCDDDQTRTCANRSALRCRETTTNEDGFNTTGENMVCGADGRTYRSFCHMIAEGPAVPIVAHSGSCDRPECMPRPGESTSEVCGTDGATYKSVCHLRSQSGNARVDYRGRCGMSDGKERSVNDTCEMVRSMGRCETTQDNCETRVMSRDGCCPICGGITTMAIDRDTLDEYCRSADCNRDLDEFMGRLNRPNRNGTRAIPDEVMKRCNVSASMVRRSSQTNIDVTFEARDRKNDGMYCHMRSKNFTSIMNGENPDNSGVTETTELPVEASFVLAASSPPLVTDSGAAGTTVVSGLLLLLASLVALLFAF